MKMILFFLRCGWTFRILWQSRVVCSSAGDLCNHETLDRPHSRGQGCGSLIIFRIDSLFWQIDRRRFSPTEIYFFKMKLFSLALLAGLDGKKASEKGNLSVSHRKGWKYKKFEYWIKSEKTNFLSNVKFCYENPRQKHTFSGPLTKTRTKWSRPRFRHNGR